VRRLDCLECVVDGTRLLVPVQDLDRVAEYELTLPPPQAAPWVGGLGHLDGLAYVSLALPGRPRGPLSAAKGLLLRASGSDRRYAVQVDDVRALWTVDADDAGPAEVPGWPCPPAWLGVALEGGEPVLRLDTTAVAASLFPAAPASPTEGSGS
jgi:hypothetical protein